MAWYRFLRNAVRSTGFDAARHGGGHLFAEGFVETFRREKLSDGSIRTVLDVGGAVGQYGNHIREHGFAGSILSFEPQNRSYQQLQQHATADGRWTAYHTALGSEESEIEMHVASNYSSSSILPMSGNQVFGITTTAVEKVKLSRLDKLALSDASFQGPAWMKLDVQGYEIEVLKGATAILEHVPYIESELSIASLYEGQPLIGEVINYLDSLGYDLFALGNPLVHKESIRIMQLDGIFVRKGFYL
jgi:FkbM family methyltransferase